VGGYGASVQRLWFAFDLRICSDVHPSNEVQSMFTIQQRRNIVPTSECELLNHALDRFVRQCLYVHSTPRTQEFSSIMPAFLCMFINVTKALCAFVD
jgi:hypothetical protein